MNTYKLYEFTLKHDSGIVTLRISGSDIKQAKRALLEAEKAPESAIQSWRIVPTAKQIRRTKSLMRGI